MQQESAHLPEDTASQATAHALRALFRFVNVVRRRKFVVIGAVTVACLLGLLYYKSATPYYQATASLLVERTSSDVGQQYHSTSRDLIETYRQLLVSDMVLQGALKYLEQFPPEINRGAPRELWAPMLRSLLTTSNGGSASTINVSCHSQDAKACIVVINAVLRSSLEFLEANQKNLSLDLVSRLDKERRSLEDRLFHKERELLQIKRRMGEINFSQDSKTVHPVVQRALGLNESFLDAQRQRLLLEASLQAIRRADREGRDLTNQLKVLEPFIGKEFVERALAFYVQQANQISDIEKRLFDDRTQLATLYHHYGEAHPRVAKLRQRIESGQSFLANSRARMEHGVRDKQLSQTLIDLVESSLADAWEHEKTLQEQYALAERDAVALNDRLAEVAIQEREVSLLRELHDSLLNRIAKLEVDLDQNQVRVAVIREPLLPGAPAFPNLTQIMSRHFLVGLVVGLMFVYVLDLLDDRFRSAQELEEQLGVPVLAMIRELTVSGSHGIQSLQVHVAPNSIESDSFRTLRTTLVLGGQQPERLAVTSAEPGDGKTTVLANLAVTFAQAGKRTLIIDADMRRPGLSKLLGMRRPDGLSEVLRSEEDVVRLCGQRIQPSGIDGLDVLPSGPKALDPAELLSSSRFADLIAWAETAYDHVLIDCPPILAVRDAAIVAKLVDGIILVVQPEKNHRRSALRAVKELTLMGVSPIGLVINRVNPDEENGYYYGYGYGYGSGHDDEPLDEYHDGHADSTDDLVAFPGETGHQVQSSDKQVPDGSNRRTGVRRAA